MNIFHPQAKLSKLFTNHDPYYFHKFFGFLSLGSYVYRYLFVYNQEGNLGMEGTVFDWITMVVHSMLSLSAIIFYVPKKRIHDKPMIIYEEYRQHAMVFTLRCFFVFALAVLFPNRAMYISPVIVALHHIEADRITAKYGTDGNTAVRSTSELVKDDSYYKLIISKFYSFYQFLAIASHIIMNERSADLAFNSLIAIQSSAFAMTLYRKKIIKGKGHLVIYAGSLLLSTFHIIRLLSYYTLFTVFITFLLRINLKNNQLNSKYFLWTLFLLVN